MKRDKSFKGFEMMLNRIKMELKMHLFTLLFFVVIQAIAFSAVSYVFIPKGCAYYALKYVEASAAASLRSPRVFLLSKMRAKHTDYLPGS